MCVYEIVSQAKNHQMTELPSADPYAIGATWSIMARSVLGIEGLSTVGGRTGCSRLNGVIPLGSIIIPYYARKNEVSIQARVSTPPDVLNIRSVYRD